MNYFSFILLLKKLGEEKLILPYNFRQCLHSLKNSESTAFWLAVYIFLTYFLQLGETLIRMFLITRFSQWISTSVWWKQTSAFWKHHKMISQNNTYTLQESLLKINLAVSFHEWEGFSIVYSHIDLLPVLFSPLCKTWFSVTVIFL